MDTTTGVCKEPPDDESLAIDLVEIVGIACKSPADIAGFKRADFVVSINGVTINGLSQHDYEDLLETAVGGGASWVILRKSFGRWEKKELRLVPAEINHDFSCGVPDVEL
jgi:C-terminal processing protease CtpA/Prc